MFRSIKNLLFFSPKKLLNREFSKKDKKKILFDYLYLIFLAFFCFSFLRKSVKWKLLTTIYTLCSLQLKLFNSLHF